MYYHLPSRSGRRRSTLVVWHAAWKLGRGRVLNATPRALAVSCQCTQTCSWSLRRRRWRAGATAGDGAGMRPFVGDHAPRHPHPTRLHMPTGCSAVSTPSAGSSCRCWHLKMRASLAFSPPIPHCLPGRLLRLRPLRIHLLSLHQRGCSGLTSIPSPSTRTSSHLLCLHPKAGSLFPPPAARARRPPTSAQPFP